MKLLIKDPSDKQEKQKCQVSIKMAGGSERKAADIMTDIAKLYVLGKINQKSFYTRRDALIKDETITDKDGGVGEGGDETQGSGGEGGDETQGHESELAVAAEALAELGGEGEEDISPSDAT